MEKGRTFYFHQGWSFLRADAFPMGKAMEKWKDENGNYFYQTEYREVGGQAVLGRQLELPTPWLTERHGYDPT